MSKITITIKEGKKTEKVICDTYILSTATYKKKGWDSETLFNTAIKKDLWPDKAKHCHATRALDLLIAFIEYYIEESEGLCKGCKFDKQHTGTLDNLRKAKEALEE